MPGTARTTASMSAATTVAWPLLQRAEVHAPCRSPRRRRRRRAPPRAPSTSARSQPCGKPTTRDDARVRAGKRGGGDAHPARLHAVEADAPRAHDRRAGANVRFGRLGLQHRMVEDAGELGAVHGAFRAAIAARARDARGERAVEVARTARIRASCRARRGSRRRAPGGAAGARLRVPQAELGARKIGEVRARHLARSNGPATAVAGSSVILASCVNGSLPTTSIHAYERDGPARCARRRAVSSSFGARSTPHASATPGAAKASAEPWTSRAGSSAARRGIATRARMRARDARACEPTRIIATLRRAPSRRLARRRSDTAAPSATTSPGPAL